MENSRKLRIAIIGGGIGGLTCAVALKNSRDIEIDLYEQAAQITEIGAGITVWPRTWDILKSLDLEEDLLAVLPEEYSDEQKLAFEFRISDRNDGFTFHKMYARGGALCFHRQEMQTTLLKHVPETCQIHLNHRLVRCEEKEDSVKLFFKNGEEGTCDVLIAADGIHSVARELIPNGGIFYTGTQVFRGLIPKEKMQKLYPNHRTLRDPVMYAGKNQHIVVYPISGGRIINVVAFFSKLEDEGKPLDGPEIRSATTEEAVDKFSGWEEEVTQLLSSIEKPTRWVIRDLYPMETYVSRRIALVGDAAHNMTPHLGAGAGQAMEDGYILGRLFSEVGSAKWDRVLQAYNLVRHPFGNMVQRNARAQGFYYELNAPGFENIKDKGQELSPEQISILCNTITENWSWWEDDANEDLAQAVEFLNES
ncbi:hypothetical protein GYMLUDRAFT_51021 [Collybiopsis luxurians FD-317 M1]|uniref:FAD-binding domain-containing protein n=1 Tax=Collybiopsis luxurians FD-317 M1 TaxID=944289 RepID=A0A0D0B971_9AGAR|nr:hypothetical protein GYMLUDRAFT_51021 [Collybiopsis luxurians FD-317 M1]